MNRRLSRSSRRGFALVELAATAAIGFVVVALLVLATGDHRRLARLGEDIGKLGTIGSLTGQYGSDNADKFWAFSWKKGQALSQWPELNNAPTDLQAAANQAIDILRRRAGRTDIFPIFQWMPHTLYSHLVLEDYGGRVPEGAFISSMDKHRIKWARDPRGYDMGLYQPSPGFASNDSKRWPYSASFSLPSCFYDLGLPPNRLSQGPSHNQTFTPSIAALGPQVVSEVAFPSQKVHLHDAHARHFGAKHPYATHNEARLPMLFVDGSVSVRAAADSNPGWLPNNPGSASPTSFSYSPGAWEPATFSGGFSEQVIGRFRWTRGIVGGSGIKGRDFSGPETCSGQPGCP